ncbi:hypothetical protein B0H19DRAFT_1180838 [Mycena capillaripes]|nr:hypothetical protein B0H19DRAFT_1180838 [Mycena capillaripes]
MSTRTIAGKALEGLGDDVLLMILSLSDVYTVLCVSQVRFSHSTWLSATTRVSQVNRHLRAIAMVKQLWILLITDLRSRSFIETPLADLSQFTTAQLIEQVKTLVVGPRTWGEVDSDGSNSGEVQPQLAAEITLPFGTVMKHHTQLINAGRHLIIAHEVLEIWDVANKRRVWASSRYTRNFSVAREVEDNTLTVAVISLEKTLDILRFDIQTWSLTDTLKIAVPEDPFVFLRKDSIVGNLVVVDLEHVILLVDWIARTYVVLIRTTTQLRKYIVALLPGQLIVLDASRDIPKLLAYPIAGLNAWQPLSELSTSPYCPTAHLTPTLIAEVPLLDDQPLEDAEAHMAIHESPLRRGTYQFFIYLSEVNDRLGWQQRQPRAALFRYSCVVSDTEVRSTLVKAAHAIPWLFNSCFTYSGYAMYTQGVYRVAKDRNDNHESEFDYRRGRIIESLILARGEGLLSAYNGVVLTVMPTSVVLSYYL